VSGITANIFTELIMSMVFSLTGKVYFSIVTLQQALKYIFKDTTGSSCLTLVSVWVSKDETLLVHPHHYASLE